MSSEKSSKSMEISHEGPVTGSVVAEKLEKDESKVLTDQDCTSDQEHKHEKMNLEDSKSQDSVQSKPEVEKLSDAIEQEYVELQGTTIFQNMIDLDLRQSLIELQHVPALDMYLKDIYKNYESS